MTRARSVIVLGLALPGLHGPWVLVEAPPPAFAKLPKGPKGHLPPGLAKKGKVPPGWRDD